MWVCVYLRVGVRSVCVRVYAKMASRKYPFLNRIQDKNRTKSQSQSQLQHPESLSLSTLQNVPCAWQSKWKMETEKMSSSWARKWRDISQGKCANLSFTYIQVVIFRLSYVRVYTAESCVLVRLYFTTSFGACMRAVFYRAPFKSTMLFHSHLPFIIFRALFINQHYIP